MRLVILLLILVVLDFPVYLRFVSSFVFKFNGTYLNIVNIVYMHYLLCFWFHILFFKQFDYPRQPLTWTEGLALDVMMGCQYACRAVAQSCIL